MRDKNQQSNEETKQVDNLDDQRHQVKKAQSSKQNLLKQVKPLEDIPIEILLEKEKVLDSEINEECDKAKLQSDLVSTIKRIGE